MADEIIKVLEYILNNETLRTIGTAYIAYVAVIALIVIVAFVFIFKSIIESRNRMKKFRKW